jgi:hypothetical protein
MTMRLMPKIYVTPKGRDLISSTALNHSQKLTMTVSEVLTTRQNAI